MANDAKRFKITPLLDAEGKPVVTPVRENY